MSLITASICRGLMVIVFRADAFFGENLLLNKDVVLISVLVIYWYYYSIQVKNFIKSTLMHIS